MPNISPNDRPKFTYEPSLFLQPALKESGKRSVVVSSAKPESAFLGPKIWKNPITLPMLSGNNGSGDAEFSIMNIDDFLNENNFDFDR